MTRDDSKPTWPGYAIGAALAIALCVLVPPPRRGEPPDPPPVPEAAAGMDDPPVFRRTTWSRWPARDRIQDLDPEPRLAEAEGAIVVEVPMHIERKPEGEVKP